MISETGFMALLLDIDGTILDAGYAIPGAADAIDRLRARGVPFLFATNTTRQSRAETAKSLRDAGVDASDHEIWSAGFAAASLLRERGVRRVQLLLTASAHADYHGFEIVDERPEIVVVGDLGREFSFDVLNAAFRSLRNGAGLVAAHKNRFWKSADGFTIDAGPFVVALEYAARVVAEVVGKPAPAFFAAAARLLGVEPPSLTIVGDDLETDVAGGRAAGLDTILVRTGKFDAARLAELPPAARPGRVVDSIADIPGALLENSSS